MGVVAIKRTRQAAAQHGGHRHAPRTGRGARAARVLSLPLAHRRAVLRLPHARTTSASTAGTSSRPARATPGEFSETEDYRRSTRSRSRSTAAGGIVAGDARAARRSSRDRGGRHAFERRGRRPLPRQGAAAFRALLRPQHGHARGRLRRMPRQPGVPGLRPARDRARSAPRDPAVREEPEEAARRIPRDGGRGRCRRPRRDHPRRRAPAEHDEVAPRVRRQPLSRLPRQGRPTRSTGRRWTTDALDDTLHRRLLAGWR